MYGGIAVTSPSDTSMVKPVPVGLEGTFSGCSHYEFERNLLMERKRLSTDAEDKRIV